jgi:hypothetical protein
MDVSVAAVRGAQTRHRFTAAWAALLVLPLSVLAVAAQAADAGAAANAASARSSVDGNSKLSKITIESTREQALRHKVDHFVASVMAPPPAREGLMRWNSKICPLVVGLPRNMGDLILARISQAARDAGAPLAGRHCQANLFVVVTPHPHQILKEWMARNPRVDTRHGIEPLKDFLDSKRPIRVWYNPIYGCPGGVPNSNSAAMMSGIGLPDAGGGKHVAAGPERGMGPTFCSNRIDTPLTYGEVRSIGYAIVVADTHQLGQKHVTVGQLAGYVSLVGLADIEPGADGGGAPTILRLFKDPNPPQGMTPWDKALLYTLYNTAQQGKLQLTDMEVAMTKQIAH